MKINDLIKLLSHRLNYLNSTRENAVAMGNLKQVVEIDADVAETQATIAKLEQVQ